MSSFVKSLSDNPNRPCFFVQYGETFLLLDCGLDARSVLHFLPVSQVFTASLAGMPIWPQSENNPFLYSTRNEILINEGHLLLNGAIEFQLPDLQQITPEDLHYVLISNFAQLFALPYLIQEKNFHGRIFATAPTVQLARDVFQDMINYLDSYGSPMKAEKWKVKEVKQLLPAVLQNTRPELWQSLCSTEALETSLKRLEVINFRQTLFLENSLSITAHSSGFCMGSCNWLIQAPKEKLLYLSDSSTLTTHVLPIDLQDARFPDVVIAAALNMDPQRSPEDSLKMMGQAIKECLREGGNVLIPFSSVDLLIDVLEYLFMYMEDLPTHLPVNVIAATAHSMLSLAQVFSEWLNKDYRDKAYLPEEPFIHGQMARAGRLRIFPSVDGKFSESFKSPCIVLCSHHSLRMGPAVHLLSQWKTSPKNTLVLIDSEFHPSEALQPYLPIQMKVAYCPLDTRLKPFQLTKILDSLQPRALVIHERYLQPLGNSADSADYIVRCPASTRILPIRGHHDIPLPLRSACLNVVAATPLLSSLPLIPVDAASSGDGKILAGRCFGGIRTLDNKYYLETIGRGGARITAGDRSPDVAKLVRLMRKEGFGEVRLEVEKDRSRVICGSHEMEVVVSKGATEVVLKKPSRELRGRMRALLQAVRGGETAAVTRLPRTEDDLQSKSTAG
ncbi:integrator complex subunit 9-like [Paramacrobiotus metropolitanus]|uniref:integrator complex subunit 9-like n=1 Tax=Paramacrobiotus metropolitanus TaxID=2943436 RepID=UPI0024456FF1|nr:integrator complex subunit 9-like [Paramacrobiotus metropolitanus]